MFNTYVVHNMSMFSVPSAKLFHIHTAPSHVAWTQCILLSYHQTLDFLDLYSAFCYKLYTKCFLQ